MHGIQYVTDELGEKTGVLIDLKENGELWEDFYDVALTAKRKHEPRESIESVKTRSPHLPPATPAEENVAIP